MPLELHAAAAPDQAQWARAKRTYRERRSGAASPLKPRRTSRSSTIFANKPPGQEFDSAHTDRAAFHSSNEPHTDSSNRTNSTGTPSSRSTFLRLTACPHTLHEPYPPPANHHSHQAHPTSPTTEPKQAAAAEPQPQPDATSHPATTQASDPHPTPDHPNHQSGHAHDTPAPTAQAHAPPNQTHQ